MTAEELGRALIDTAKRRPLAAGEGSAMIQAAIEREQQVARIMALGKAATDLDFACQRWLQSKTQLWRDNWTREIERNKALLMELIGNANS